MENSGPIEHGSGAEPRLATNDAVKTGDAGGADRDVLRHPDFPLGAAVTLEELDDDPHPVLARLRAHEPVSWLPALDGWLVTRHDLVLAAMRDADAFTVDDPRFSTAQVVGPSMLSLDGSDHARHRAPFVAPFRSAEVTQRFAQAAADEAANLVATLSPRGRGELRTEFAGPMAAAIVARALGLERDEVSQVLAWYGAIVGSVTAITAGEGATAEGEAAFAALRRRLADVIQSGASESLLAAAARGGGGLALDQVVSNAAVLLFGGIETTEGMIATALLYSLRSGERPHQDERRLDAVIDESLRLEPAAAVIDRYATEDVVLGDAHIVRGQLVRLSLTAANRDPAVFTDPDVFDPRRANLRRHVAFAQGPHVCVGVHLARLEARVALATLLRELPRLRLRLDPGSDTPARVRGLVFRKPVSLPAVWE